MAHKLIDTVSAGKYAYAVRFNWGTSWQHSANYICFDQDYQNSHAEELSGGTYLAEPPLELDFGTQTGGAQDQPVKVRMTQRNPVNLLCRPYAFARVRVTIEELDPTDPETLPTVLFLGFVTTSVMNKASTKDLVELNVSGWRSFLQYPMGIQATDLCDWNFTDKNCCIKKSEIAVAGLIEDVTDRIVNASTLVTPDGAPANYWMWGWIELDGLAITIRNDGLGVGALEMVDRPPPEWIGETAIFVPGCNKELTTCRDKWNNEERYMGLGRFMTAYNPNLGAGG